MNRIKTEQLLRLAAKDREELKEKLEIYICT